VALCANSKIRIAKVYKKGLDWMKFDGIYGNYYGGRSCMSKGNWIYQRFDGKNLTFYSDYIKRERHP